MKITYEQQQRFLDLIQDLEGVHLQPVSHIKVNDLAHSIAFLLRCELERQKVDDNMMDVDQASEFGK